MSTSCIPCLEGPCQGGAEGNRDRRGSAPRIACPILGVDGEVSVQGLRGPG